MGLGMPEVVLILVIALIVFGPRKLPELGKSLGQAMSQFRKASDDFKRTWEQEVESETYKSPDTTSAAISNYSSSNENYPGDGYHQESHAAVEPEAGQSPSSTDEAIPDGSEPVPAAGTPAVEKQRWI
ncbi:MAG: TatA/E family twin arginine-targeting protein translocase [Acidobacteria bacterium]|nr:TatA/E family twin arginine-targeting protein translocase [Acidobacteriota bacterium]